MWFNIVTNNHGSLNDCAANLHLTIKYFREAISACGHEVTVEHEMVYKEAINLYFEHFFNDDFYKKIIAIKRQHGLRMGLITTELVVDGTIPYARHGIRAGAEKDKAAYIARRVAGQEIAARDMDFVWSMIERTSVGCRKFNPISEFFPVGHTGSVPTTVRRSPKDIDVCFFGAKTPHRERVLQALAAQGLRVVAVGGGFPQGYLPEDWLNSLLDRSKIGLNLTLHARDESVGDVDPRFASCIRLAEMLGREVCIVSEHIPLDNPYAAFTLSAPPDGLAALCREVVDGGRWRQFGPSAAAAFRTAMDAGTICAPVIERTLKALGLPRTA